MKLFAITPALLAAACASQPFEEQPVVSTPYGTTISVVQEDKAEVPEAGPVATGALKGAGKGATACAMPVAVGARMGPIGFVVGGIITLYCLPFGIVGGAVIGGIAAAAPIDQSAAVSDHVN